MAPKKVVISLRTENNLRQDTKTRDTKNGEGQSIKMWWP